MNKFLINLKLKVKNFVEKLRVLHDNQKKIVLWTTVTILAIIMGIFWFRATINRFSNLETNFGNIQFPEIELSGIQIPNNENTDWQTYTNKEYGFEIRYPKNLVLIQKDEAKNIFILENNSRDYPELSVWFRLAKQGDNLPELNFVSSQFIEIKKSEFVEGDIIWKTVEEINIPIEGRGTAGSTFTVYTEKAGKTYVFRCFNCSSEVFGNYGINKKINFDQVMSTFKFTD
jgi:hypothetical protein